MSPGTQRHTRKYLRCRRLFLINAGLIFLSLIQSVSSTAAYTTGSSHRATLQAWSSDAPSVKKEMAKRQHPIRLYPAPSQGDLEPMNIKNQTWIWKRLKKALYEREVRRFMRHPTVEDFNSILDIFDISGLFSIDEQMEIMGRLADSVSSEDMLASSIRIAQSHLRFAKTFHRVEGLVFRVTNRDQSPHFYQVRIKLVQQSESRYDFEIREIERGDLGEDFEVVNFNQLMEELMQKKTNSGRLNALSQGSSSADRLVAIVTEPDFLKEKDCIAQISGDFLKNRLQIVSWQKDRNHPVSGIRNIAIDAIRSALKKENVRVIDLPPAKVEDNAFSRIESLKRGIDIPNISNAVLSEAYRGGKITGVQAHWASLLEQSPLDESQETLETTLEEDLLELARIFKDTASQEGPKRIYARPGARNIYDAIGSQYLRQEDALRRLQATANEKWNKGFKVAERRHLMKSNHGALFRMAGFLTSDSESILHNIVYDIMKRGVDRVGSMTLDEFKDYLETFNWFDEDPARPIAFVEERFTWITRYYPQEIILLLRAHEKTRECLVEDKSNGEWTPMKPQKPNFKDLKNLVAFFIKEHEELSKQFDWVLNNGFLGSVNAKESTEVKMALDIGFQNASEVQVKVTTPGSEKNWQVSIENSSDDSYLWTFKLTKGPRQVIRDANTPGWDISAKMDELKESERLKYNQALRYAIEAEGLALLNRLAARRTLAMRIESMKLTPRGFWILMQMMEKALQDQDYWKGQRQRSALENLKKEIMRGFDPKDAEVFEHLPAKAIPAVIPPKARFNHWIRTKVRLGRADQVGSTAGSAPVPAETASDPGGPNGISSAAVSGPTTLYKSA